MAQWLAPLLVQALIGLLLLGVIYGTVKATLSSHAATMLDLRDGINKGQDVLHTAIKELTTAVAQLTTNAAINASQHDDLHRRLEAIEATLNKHEAAIVTLRTRSHLLGNKMMHLDPAWRDYRE